MFRVNGGFPKLSKNNAPYKNAVFHVVYQFLKSTSSALVLFAVTAYVHFQNTGCRHGFKKYWPLTGRRPLPNLQ